MMSRTGLNWMQWNPGTNHGERTFREVLSTLPAAAPEDIPKIIRFFENPSSPWASPGAITLARHDHIHVLLGRGLRSEDEAFVIGFTNGAATGEENYQTRLLRILSFIRYPVFFRIGDYRVGGENFFTIDFKDQQTQRNRVIRDWQYKIFQFAATHLYRKPYQFTKMDIMAYQLGFNLGERNRVKNLQNFPFEEHEDDSIDRVREMLGINIFDLESVYRVEKILLNTKEANRLDTNFDQDHSDIVVPEFPASDWVKLKE